MTISFRIRLFVMVGLIVGTVLTAVLAIGWSSVLASAVVRLDERLCMETRRLATQDFQRQGQAQLAVDLLDKLHLAAPEQLMLRFESTQQRGNFQSANWHSVQFIPPDGLVDKPPPPRRTEADRPALHDRPAEPGTCALATFDLQGVHWRLAQFSVPDARGLVAVDLAATKAELKGVVQRALGLAIPLALVLTAWGAWLLSGWTMRPVNRLREAMKVVTQQGLSQRLPSKGEDHEFKDLMEAFNTMLSRLETSFQQATRFSADAAHELKTPLTILQGRIEQAINKSEHRAIQTDLTGLLDEVGRLSAITRKLLLLSHADAGQLALHLSPIDLSAVLDELALDAQMLLTGQTLHCAIERQLSLQGDAVLLRQLFNNLISNAVRYSRAGGLIRLTAQAHATGIEVVFFNDTSVIQAADRARFFDRFYRGDASHNRHIEGNGLGLSLAREIARAHGGDLTLEMSASNEVKLRLTLPPG